MKSTKTFGLVLLAIFILNVTSIAPIYASALTAENNEDITETIDGATTKLELLRNKYLRDGVKLNSEPFKGVAFDDSTAVFEQARDDKAVLLLENLIGMTALLKDFQATGTATSDSWAQLDVWNEIEPLISNTQIKGVSRSTYYKENIEIRKYAIDQFYFLEFTSESFSLADNSKMNGQLKDVYNMLEEFEANFTYNGEEYSGAYWTAVERGEQFISDSEELSPQNNVNPLTNTSLWAAAGISHFVMTQKGTKEDQLYFYSRNGTFMAEQAFAYAEVSAWSSSIGLFLEDITQKYSGNQTSVFNGTIFVETQIAGLLACARLYQLTGKSSYIEKADLILSNIIQYFGDVGQGGIYTAIDNNLHVTGMKNGYDNALFAYALTQLGIATGAEDVDLKGFFNGRPENRYMNLAFSIINFMNNYMWKVGEGNIIEGYVEYIDSLGRAVDQIHYTNTTRFIKTNMFAMYVLSNIVYQSRSWAEWYETYALITAVTLGIIIFVAIIMKIRSSEGSRVSRVVKGLMEEDES